MVEIFMKRFISVLLLLIFLTAVLIAGVSCGDKNSEGGDADRPQNQADAEHEDAGSQNEAANTKLPPPELPDMDLKGADFVILTSNLGGSGVNTIWDQRDIGAEEETGDTINDAVYKRNSIVEEKLNCKIVDRQVHLGQFGTDVQKAVRAGDATIDAVTPRAASVFPNLIVNNCLVNFEKLPYIALSKPWWDQNCAGNLSICGKIFGVASDMTLMDKDSTTAIVFNKQLQTDYQIENLYQLVSGGKWTIDKLLDLSKIVSVDVDGNGIRDDKDAYGLLYQIDSMTSFLSGCGGFVGGKDKNDLPVMTLITQKSLDVLDKLFDVLYDDMYCLNFGWSEKISKDALTVMNEMFQENRALFMWIRMADVENLRSMETDFGILPIPKYDEAQEQYLSTVNPYVGVLTSVPNCAANLANSSAVLEYMAYEGKYILQPAYYDVVLATKIARDEESGKMLDIIFGNRAYDIGEVFNFGSLGTELAYMSRDRERNIVSNYEKKEAGAIEEIEKLVEIIQGME